VKKLIVAGLAAVILCSGPAIAQDANADAAVGGAAGGMAGAAAGAVIFGPLGAAIGGFTGAVIGADAGVDSDTIDYVRVHPVDPVVIDTEPTVGYVVPDSVTIQPIESDPAHGYFYTKDRVWIVDMSNRQVVYSPGVVVAAK
jgi:hypothetical protein